MRRRHRHRSVPYHGTMEMQRVSRIIEGSTPVAEGERRSRLRIIVSGQVQGVFFRAGARDEAMRLGIAGFARNNPDGSVLIEAEGSSSAVERFRTWCATGPPRARVDHIDVSPIDLRGERTFVTQ